MLQEDILMANEIEAGLIEPIPAVHVIDGAVVEAAEAGGVEAVDLYAQMRQARAGRVEEFSRRNRLVAQVERRWLEVRPDEVYPYGPMEFSAPGPVGIKRVEDSRNELSFFLEIFDEDLIRYMVRCTNKYARERRFVHRGEKRSRWSATSTAELKAFLGCMICAGYAHQPSLASYWSTDEDAGCAVMKRAFPFNRYRQLLRYLHYSPEGFPPPGSERLKVFKAREKEDRVLKVRAVMARVNENSCRARHVGQNLVVDEATVAFRGRHMLRRYNPAKPTKYGYCVRALAEPDGYILSDELCGARKDPETMSPDERVMHGIGDELLSPLDLKPARVLNRLTVPFQGCYRTVFCDSYYTDVQLADYLFSKDTYLVGTVRKCASGLPTERHHRPFKPRPRPRRGRPPMLPFRESYPSDVPRGTSIRYHDGGPLTVMKWKDTKTLMALSTATTVDAPGVRVIRRSKRFNRQEISCPLALDLYNRHYKAIDTADQLRGSYHFGRPSKKWHRKLFWYAVNKAAVNAYLNWKMYISNRQPPLPQYRIAQLNFRRALMRQLVGNFSARRRAVVTVDDPGVRLGRGTVVGEHHQVSRGKPTKVCRYCARAGRLMSGARRSRPHETVYRCNTCNVSVCNVSLRPECWREHLQDMRADR
ncbi:piggyBac transposable element-derived protein 4-like [Branchiostoma lanceolatum]|uniref:piggyBac transposable element-derived protein 4-like n=1 Tax=Branchiostoma lanceolatum TaxID=7740 RepID=UPI003456C02D